MKAIDITGSPPGGERTPIAQLVPLDTPLVIQIFPIYACNFTCKYCTFSISKEKRGFISDKIIMPLELFKKCIDDCKKFPNQIKVLRFVGMGEPLLHKDLSDMIAYASISGKFDRIEILTNASLLTPQLSDKLIQAGLTRLLISIQGISTKKYKEISNIDINWDTFINNIQYFYQQAVNKCKVHIKIIDCALDNEEDKQRFFNIFGDICDTIGIECVGPIYPGVKLNQQLQKTNKNQYGAESSNIDICSQAFFFMQINPDGNIVPCHAIPHPESMGNANKESLDYIWNGPVYNWFRYRMLEGITNVCDVCKNCNIFKHRAYKNDDLTNKISFLKNKYKE